MLANPKFIKKEMKKNKGGNYAKTSKIKKKIYNWTIPICFNIAFSNEIRILLPIGK